MDPPKKMGSDDEVDIDDGMIVMLQHEIGKVHMNMLTRYNIHLWTIVAYIEDGRYNTLFMRVVLTR